MTIKELEIIKAALEGDIIQQKESDKAEHPAFKEWLKDTEKLLKKVSRKLFEMKAKQQIFESLKKK
jgi:2-keto-3-deoxy-galactonokinase